MVRDILTASELQKRMNLELAVRRARECPSGCKVPLPFRWEPPSALFSNWQVRPPRCRRGCDEVIRAIQEEYQQRYKLVELLARSTAK